MTLFDNSNCRYGGSTIRTGTMAINASSSATTTGTATIAAVADVTKTKVRVQGVSFSGYAAPDLYYAVDIVLTNATTVTASVSLVTSDSSAVPFTIRYEIEETG